MSSAKVKNIKKDEPLVEEIEQTEIEKLEFEEKKSEKFFENITGFDKKFYILLYRVLDKGKSEQVAEWINEMPESYLTEIRDVYGGGRYRLYAFELSESGRKGKLLDSTEVNLAKRLDEDKPTITSPGTDDLQKFEAFSNIMKNISGNNSSSGINEAIVKMMLHQSTTMAAQQQKSDERFYQVMEKMNKGNDTGGIKGILETIELVDRIKGGGSDGDNKNMLEKFMSSPIAEPIINQLIGSMSEKNKPMEKQVMYDPTKQEKKVIPPKKLEVTENTLDGIVANLDPEFVNRITVEMKSSFIDELFEKNKSVITKLDSVKIIEYIIKRQEGVT